MNYSLKYMIYILFFSFIYCQTNQSITSTPSIIPFQEGSVYLLVSSGQGERAAARTAVFCGCHDLRVHDGETRAGAAHRSSTMVAGRRRSDRRVGFNPYLAPTRRPFVNPPDLRGSTGGFCSDTPSHETGVSPTKRVSSDCQRSRRLTPRGHREHQIH